MHPAVSCVDQPQIGITALGLHAAAAFDTSPTRRGIDSARMTDRSRNLFPAQIRFARGREWSLQTIGSRRAECSLMQPESGWQVTRRRAGGCRPEALRATSSPAFRYFVGFNHAAGTGEAQLERRTRRRQSRPRGLCGLHTQIFRDNENARAIRCAMTSWRYACADKIPVQRIVTYTPRQATGITGNDGHACCTAFRRGA